tara:strand:- start:784 stop:1029 length:246 start_codon:yes stop_codon:yes gene_type:complete
MSKIDLKDIKLILKETFPKSKSIDDIMSLQMGDLKEWDSLGNYNLLLAIEQFYKVRFSNEEISIVKSIKQIVTSLNDKIKT